MPEAMPIRTAAWRRLFMPPPRRAILPDSILVETPGGAVEVTIRRSDRARRLSLRCRPGDDGFELVVPPRTPADQALGFATAQAGWIATRVAALAPRLVFADGAEIPLLGGLVRIAAEPGSRAPGRLEDGRLLIGGRPEFLARRVRDFLIARARAEVAPRARRFAAVVDRPVGRISLRDPKSRWGSCSGKGDLAFSWRLILAPETVLTYVVAHEVAHLVEMNHSPRFWAVVDRLVPDADAGRAWLRANGARLQRIG